MQLFVDLKHIMKGYNLTNGQKRLFNAITLEPTAHLYSAPYMARHHLTKGGIASAIRQLQSIDLVTLEGGVWHVKCQELQRWWTKVLSRDSTEAEDMRFIDSCAIHNEVTKRAIEVFGSEEKARRWLHTPNFALGDVRPVDLLRTKEGTDEVLGILGRIEHGVFV